MAGAQKYDVIVIGAGHNGLTTAAFLAKSGRRVVVLEQRDQIGGMAAAEEFHRGYIAPGVLHDTATVRHNLIRSLDLPRHGLELGAPPSIYAPESGGGLLLHSDVSRAREEIARFSQRDADRYKEFCSFVSRTKSFINGLLDDAPPDLLSPSPRIDWSLLKKGNALRKLGKSDMMELARVVPMSAADWLDEWFETDLLKALLAGPAIHGAFMGPRSPGSALNVLIWECRKGPVVKGGAPALVRALEQSAEANGAEIRTSAKVEGIAVEGGMVVGVTVDGERIECRAVASSCDPRKTMLELVPASEITDTLAGRMKAFRARGTSAKVNIALDARLELAGRPGEAVEVVRTGECLDDLEKAFDAIKYKRFSERPILDIYVPASGVYAPPGHSVMSVMAYFVPYELDGDWNYTQREALGEAVVTVLNEFAPRIKDAVQSVEVLTPVELESRYGSTEGHVYHGEHALDQLLIRPAPECSGYRSPIGGLYLCGSGSHPGGGLTCTPGALAARVIQSS